MSPDAVSLIASLLLPAALGGLAASYLSPVLLGVLAELCCGEDRAQFWVRMTGLGMVLGPTGLALARVQRWQGIADTVEMLRSLLSVSVNGLLCVFSILALAMWRQIPGNRAGGAKERDL